MAGTGNRRISYPRFQFAVGGGFENLIVSSFPDVAHAHLNWVGNGLFVRQLETSNGFSVSADAFYFGLPTPTGGIPTNGSAQYGVYLLGALTRTGQHPELLLQGNAGLLSVDFLAGTVTVSGVTSYYDLITGSPGSGGYAYSGTATLSAGGFSGDFELANIDGTWDGGFFGPAGQEVGAAFRGGDGFSHYIGTLIGSSDLEFRGIETDFLDLDNSLGFPGFILEDFQEVDPDTGQTIFEGAGVRSSMEDRVVGYDPFIDEWDFQRTFHLNRDNLDPAQSDAAFDVYGDITVDANGTDGGRLLRPGPGNSLIELTYTSYGSWEYGYGADGSSIRQSVTRYHSVFGFPTKSSEMPTSGNANYSGVLFGVAGTSNNVGGAGTNDTYYSLSGSINLAVDFGTGGWSGGINPIGDDLNSDAIRDFGIFSFSDGTISEALLQNAEIDFGTTLSVGTIFGHFFGPQAAEVGGGFGIYFTDPLESGNKLSIDGLFVGTKD